MNVCCVRVFLCIWTVAVAVAVAATAGKRAHSITFVVYGCRVTGLYHGFTKPGMTNRNLNNYVGFILFLY